MKPFITWYRFLEIVPGALVWLTFVLSIVLSVVAPLWVIYFIILFDLYWLLRVLYFIIYLVYAWTKYRRALKVDWSAKLKAECPAWESFYHVIFLPTYKEGQGIIEATLDALITSRYPKEKFIVVLAGEERAGEHFTQIAEKISARYGREFYKLLVTVHPKDLPNEIASKGANINFAGHQVQRLIDGLKIPHEQVIASSFDIDTIVHPDYFASLTYTYCTTPNPTHASYQPVVLYNNNIWESPAPMRLAAFGTTFWLMTELARPDRLFTFSSHSMSFKALVDVGFWEKDVVSEDSRIFLQCFMKYHGDYTVVPLYVPVSMDTVMSATVWKSLQNLYKQQRRWAWGVEHFPYMVTKFAKDPLIPLRKKIKYLWLQSEGMYSWATTPILIFVLGRLPLLVANTSLKSTVIAQNAPYILENLMMLSMLGIVATASFSLFLLPPPPKHAKLHHRAFMILQWLILPVTSVVFSAFPAIDAQTRMMLGRYLGFVVTEKVRK